MSCIPDITCINVNNIIKILFVKLIQYVGFPADLHTVTLV